MDSCVFFPCLWLFALLWQRFSARWKWKTSPDTLALAHRGDPEVYLSNPIAPSVCLSLFGGVLSLRPSVRDPTVLLPPPRPNEAEDALLVDFKFQKLCVDPKVQF